MLQYLVRKLLLAIPLILGVMTLIFLLLEATPGDISDRFCTTEMPPDVCDAVIDKYKLDEPVYVRYVSMMGRLMTGDFGHSWTHERPVFDVVMEALPNTVVLSVVTLVVIFTVGVLMGTIQAVRQYSMLDNVLSVGSLFFYSMPSFWLALILVLLFSLRLDLLPAAGMVDPVEFEYMSGSERFFDRLRHLILPGVALGVASAAGTARYMRSSMLEVIRLDYVRTARAKGLPERTVVFKHALRNALLPIVTLLGLSLPYLFSGSVLVEIIFAWPGMGRLIVSAIFAQDTPLIIACFFVFTLMVVLGNLLADLLYSVVDPRIRLG